MKRSSINFLVGALALVLLLVGGNFNSMVSDMGDKPSTFSQDKYMDKTIILKVSIFEPEADAELGRIILNPGEQPQIVITSENPKAERLKAAWKDMQSQSSIGLTKPQRTADGVREATTNITSTSPDYYQAVWSTLERKHGFIVDRVK